MMRHGWWIVSLGVLALITTGCGKSTDKGAAKASTDSAQGTATGATAGGQAETLPSADPKVVVSAFLEAVRTGNDDRAMRLLSPVARQKAAETNRSPTPPASDTAKFEVGAVEKIGDDGARVACAWTDLDEFGKPRTDKALWVCRRETEGWRVVGVAAVVFENEPPLLLNFEDPTDMAKKQEWLRDEIARRAKAENPAQDDKKPVEASKPPQDAFRR
jgi:hypothetical protein